jgi:uncharacterized linocin/CFP29 family protein
VDHLLRDIAPIPARAWEQIDDEARERLTPQLAARRIADFDGPGGWNRAAISLGRSERLAGPAGTDPSAVHTRQRRVLPLVEVRVPFTVDRREVEDADRGAPDLELTDLDRAAQAAARLENRAVFHGWPDAGIQGILEVSPKASAIPSLPCACSACRPPAPARATSIGAVPVRGWTSARSP